MGRTIAGLFLASLLWGCQGQAPGVQPTIVMDGYFEDWARIAPSVTDAADAPHEEIDFRQVRTSYDDDWLYLYLDVGKAADLNFLKGSVYLLFDVDGTPSTGQTHYGLPGVDVIIQFTVYQAYADDRRGLAMYVAPSSSSELQSHSFYDVDFIKVPTYASAHYEINLRRHVSLPDLPPTFANEQFVVKLVFEDELGMVKDETAPAAIAFDRLVKNIPPIAETTFQKRDADLLRVMKWNSSVRRIFDDKEAFQKIVRVLDPDLIALNETAPDSTKEAFERYFREAYNDPSLPLYVAYPDSGGFLKSPIISKYPIQPSQPFSKIPHPQAVHEALASKGYTMLDPFFVNFLSRALPVNGVTVEIGARKILFLSANLLFGGGAQSPQEVIRRTESKIYNAALKKAQQEESYDGIIVGSDLNLVGTRTPLEFFVENADLDGSDLRISSPLHLDGRSSVNWFSTFRETWSPSVLDFMIYSDATLEEDRSFLFDTAVLPEAVLQAFDLRKDDLARAGDHYPIVTDFRFKR